MCKGRAWKCNLSPPASRLRKTVKCLLMRRVQFDQLETCWNQRCQKRRTGRWGGKHKPEVLRHHLAGSPFTQRWGEEWSEGRESKWVSCYGDRGHPTGRGEENCGSRAKKTREQSVTEKAGQHGNQQVKKVGTSLTGNVLSPLREREQSGLRGAKPQRLRSPWIKRRRV